MLIRVLSTITKIQKQLSAHQKMNEEDVVYIYIYNGILLCHQKGEILHLQQHGRNLSEGIRLTKVRQRQIVYDFTHT